MFPVELVSFLLNQVFAGEELLQFSRENQETIAIFLVA
jgi:hypothetical protein